MSVNGRKGKSMMTPSLSSKRLIPPPFLQRRNFSNSSYHSAAGDILQILVVEVLQILVVCTALGGQQRGELRHNPVEAGRAERNRGTVSPTRSPTNMGATEAIQSKFVCWPKKAIR